ncbi:hypothetical protein ES703_121773 [subsurface metagenome]
MPVSSAVGGTSAPAVRIGMGPCGSPPAIPWPPDSDMKMKTASAEAESAGPTVPRIPVHMKAPGVMIGIIMNPPPWAVPPASPVHDYRAIDVASHVARIISHVDNIRCSIIHIHVFDIVVRIFRRNRVDLVRHIVTHCPWSFRASGYIPYSFIAAVVLPFHFEYGIGSIEGVFDFSAGPFDIFELGLSVVFHFWSLTVSFYCGSLGNLGIKNRFRGLFCPSHMDQEMSILGVFWYLGKAFRKLIGRDVCPGAVKGFAGIPASGKQDEILLGFNFHQDVAFRVIDIEQFIPDDGLVIGFSVDDQELRRLFRNDDLGHTVVFLSETLDFFFGRCELFHILRNLLGFLPGAHNIGGLHPDLAAIQVVCFFMKHDQVRRVDHPFEFSVRDLFQPGLSFDNDQDRRIFDDHDLGRIMLKILCGSLLFFNQFQSSQKPV